MGLSLYRLSNPTQNGSKRLTRVNTVLASGKILPQTPTLARIAWLRLGGDA